MKRKGLFIAATGQNVGKTTLCLGMIAILKKQFPFLGVIKPVGQQHLEIDDGILVDKDVVLFKEHFHLPFTYSSMSPVIFPRGFTRDYLDGKISTEKLEERIKTSYHSVASETPFTLVEGTGHVGVGSIVSLSNAKVAKLLNLDVILIVKGGLGSAIDELALNKSLCEAHGVRIAGVILNRVIEEKREMVIHYVSKALEKWNIPLLGAIPYSQFLNTPTMKDFAALFSTYLIAGKENGNSHFSSVRLIATSVDSFKELCSQDELLVTPATREDILYALVDNHRQQELRHGLILTGRHPPSTEVIKEIGSLGIPTLYTPLPTYEAMRKLNSFTAKIQVQDTEKIERAISLVENHLDLSAIVK
jgi:phosphate acetyltransferase